MKIRQGFVSNSSSSSFVIVLKKKIESLGDLKEQLNLPPFATAMRVNSLMVIERLYEKLTEPDAMNIHMIKNILGQIGKEKCERESGGQVKISRDEIFDEKIYQEYRIRHQNGIFYQFELYDGDGRTDEFLNIYFDWAEFGIICYKTEEI